MISVRSIVNTLKWLSEWSGLQAVCQGTAAKRCSSSSAPPPETSPSSISVPLKPLIKFDSKDPHNLLFHHDGPLQH
jgi:hypothetical protein